MTEKMMTVDSIDHKKNKKIYVGCWIAERYRVIVSSLLCKTLCDTDTT